MAIKPRTLAANHQTLLSTSFQATERTVATKVPFCCDSCRAPSSRLRLPFKRQKGGKDAA